MALAPAMTLNKIYHCVPSTISGDSQISGFSRQWTIAMTAKGNNTFAGKAARNCATGCNRSAQRGRRPIQTPMGTQTTLATAISKRTRTIVIVASPNTQSTSPSASDCAT